MPEHQPAPVGVVGLGALGEPLLRTLAAAGLEVIGVDNDADVVADVAKRLAKSPPVRAEGGAPEVVLASRIDAVAPARAVIEAVPEHRSTKREVLRRINTVCSAETVVVTTTTGLSVVELAIASGRPARTVGLRFFSPPPGKGAAAPVDTTACAADALAVLDELLRALGTESFHTHPRAARVAEQLVFGYLDRAVRLLDEGYATREDIDTAMRLGCGLPTGPLELLDLVGLEHAHQVLTARHNRTGARRPAGSLERLRAAGHRGRTSGRGFYPYTAGGERALEADAGRAGAQRSGPAVRRVGVLGSGVMARGVAEVTAKAGLATVLRARDRNRADQAVEAVGGSLRKAVRRGRVTAEARDAALGRLEPADDLAALSDCDLVIEALCEDITVKVGAFAALDGVAQPGAVLASTTSSLPVAELAAATRRPEAVVGLHFFNPAPVMRLVEVSRTEHTADGVLDTAHRFCARLGKTAVDCTDRAGFIVNFLLLPYLNDAAAALVSDEADVAEIDTAVRRGFGFPMGPFTLLDTIGLDVALAIQRRLHEHFGDPALAPAAPLEQLVAAGQLGSKTGAGFRRVEPRR
ncbi:3-hydroxyacyl-CoA dehydrogenase family protein [Streptomyces reniochalinae]|uniref:3-hydroxyacyl-CoA dehydrogenase family protein n=1 Tax=Streptomyces reniochalinae TaxID=2250578 RepID=A0A367E992_9ACTN|nr:3-hydroxyacyl-CoA dehydrogenase family protein [Streptomyces reniochalinae]RCG13810.1 3-hydroxyacyl-CoA dehydrogenase family protein [Streptomyces reniochalinae]